MSCLLPADGQVQAATTLIGQHPKPQAGIRTRKFWCIAFPQAARALTCATPHRSCSGCRAVYQRSLMYPHSLTVAGAVRALRCQATRTRFPFNLRIPAMADACRHLWSSTTALADALRIVTSNPC